MRPARSAHLSPWVRPLVRAAATAFALLLACPASAADRIQTVSSPRATVQARALTAPAGPAATNGYPNPIVAGPWVQLGPFNQPGRMNGVVSRILNQPVVDALSDGYGFWRGYALTDIDWEEHGRSMTFGLEQGILKLVFPPVGNYFERLSGECTDGVLRYTDDDGDTWSPVTLNLDPGYEAVPGGRRLLASDMWSNVTYLVSRYYDSFAADTFCVLSISYDSGASYDPMYYFAGSHVADAWVSQDGSGQIVIAYSNGDWDDTVLQHASENGWNFEAFTNPATTNSEFTYTGLQITAQCQNGQISRVWLLRGDHLRSTTNLGATWDIVRDAWTPAGPRGLRAAVSYPDLLLWTDSEQSDLESIGKLYRSTDGGTTAQWIENLNAWGDTERPHTLSTNIDVCSWNWAPALTQAERRRDGSSVTHTVTRTAAPQAAEGTGFFERFYIASGGGIYLMQPEDTVVTLLTRNIANQQVNDVATLRNDVPAETYAATRDNDLLRTYSMPYGCDAYHSVISSLGPSVSDVVTIYQRRPEDWSYWAQFDHGLFVLGGGGPFTGTFGEAYFTQYRHHVLVQDPQQWNVAYSGNDFLQRMTYSLATNSITVTPLGGPLQATYGGIAGFGIAPSNANRWYLAMRDGTVLWSSNAGASWNNGSGAAPPVMDELQLSRVKIVVNPYDALEAWCIGRGIVHTTNGGATWTDASAGLPSAQTIVFDAAYDGTALNTIYLATEAGPFVGSGGSFASVGTPSLPAVQFRSVEALPSAGRMRFATWGAGLWDYTTGNVLDAGVAAARTLELAPRQNPVRAQGQLEYATTREGHVTLELLDVAGRRVATLVDGVRPAGRAAASFDAASMGAGVYFARLRTAEGTRTAKVVIAR